MSLNKRKCRAFADPGFKMRSHSGILHAPQIDHIIRTAIKIIDHHKTLLLYIYPSQKAAQGDSSPLWVVFQKKDDYATLERQEDGSFKWRTAAFERLGDSWDFIKRCTFYSFQDERRVLRYLKSDTNGIQALLDVQNVILGRRRDKRQLMRERKIIGRMASVPALPRGLKSWIHKSVMPAYFFYDHKRGGMGVPGICSACGHEIHLSKVKQGRKSFCPHCKHELTMKPRSRRGYCMTDRETCQVIQNVGNGELIIRIIKVYYTYKGDVPEVQIYENARQFIRLDDDGKSGIECYYHSYSSGLLTDWRKGERPVYNKWSYNFEADTCAHPYTKNLSEALKDTPWQYCPISAFYTHFHKPMQVSTFLYAYLKHPRLEHLVKVGFCSIVADLVYGYSYGYDGCLDGSRNRTHQILKVDAEDVEFLRDLDVGLSVLKIYQRYQGVKDRQKLLLWHLEHGVERDVAALLGYMTAHRFMKYMDCQYKDLCQSDASRYKNMQYAVTEYRDYLSICSKLGYDLKNSFVLYPKDLQEAHDRVAAHFQYQKDKRIEQDFIAVYRGLDGKYDFERDGLKIVYPDTPDDVVSEGHALHHCVGRYVESVADGHCIILFLRRCSDGSQPFYTIEVCDNKAVQVRGMQNCAMTPEVEAFITAWERCVLRTQLPAA